MCGREAHGLRDVHIEGSRLRVCIGCAKFGDEAINSTTEGSLSVNAEPLQVIPERLAIGSLGVPAL